MMGLGISGTGPIKNGNVSDQIRKISGVTGPQQKNLTAGPSKISVCFNGWESGSPKRWDRWHSPSPNWQEKNTYIPLIVLAFWGVKNETYHRLGEPETTIDCLKNFRHLQL